MKDLFSKAQVKPVFLGVYHAGQLEVERYLVVILIVACAVTEQVL